MKNLTLGLSIVLFELAIYTKKDILFEIFSVYSFSGINRSLFKIYISESYNRFDLLFLSFKFNKND